MCARSCRDWRAPAAVENCKRAPFFDYAGSTDSVYLSVRYRPVITPNADSRLVPRSDTKSPVFSSDPLLERRKFRLRVSHNYISVDSEKSIIIIHMLVKTI